MHRKIVQILVPEHCLDTESEAPLEITVLCSDGTVWFLDGKGWVQWELPPIPQPTGEARALGGMDANPIY